MRINWTNPFDILLRAKKRDGRKPRDHATYRRGVHFSSFSRLSKDVRCPRRLRLHCESQAHSATDAKHGHRGYLSQEKSKSARRSDAEIPLPPERFENSSPQSSVEYRHHLHQVVKGVYISGSDYGLAQPLCTFMGTIQHFRRRFLPEKFGESIKDREARDFQQRPGVSIYEQSFYIGLVRNRYIDQLGWTRPSIRQYFYRAFVEKRKI